MRIAVIPGDGIGQEVVAAALPALDLVAEIFDLDATVEQFDWGADRWLRTGVGLPEGAVAQLRAEFDAVLLGALGDPRIPDMAHGRDILLGLRRGLDLCVNHRPLPLATGTIELFRENTQGLYAGVGGIVGPPDRPTVAIDECVYTRDTVQRFLRYSLGRIRDAGQRRVTLVHKANAVPHTGRLWRELYAAELAAFPELDGTDEYVDAFCYHLVRDPGRYQGVVAPNLFGDIISDIGAALLGGLGLAASASICPQARLALFEPVHGSAPDIAGTGVANPYATVLCLALMLDHLDHRAPADALRAALAAARAEGGTPDVGGHDTTGAFMTRVLAALRHQHHRTRPREVTAQ
ncbi:isocitrate/isopropylmalate family dehydrogenase [Catellatospora methionotrophica]|uniref:isocitrate/isopropylmalate family dehydrogenase n=1 Tax=Catellatospora methionotrophica TaxID=121620 RepID=UPI0033CF3685